MFEFHPPLFWIETLKFVFWWYALVLPDLKSVHSVHSVHAVCTGLPPDEGGGFSRLISAGRART
jgi:hypothetical protein